MSEEKSKEEKGKKDETYYKICNSVLKLQVGKGHLKWKVSDIANDSGVTRSLIYYYFGKEKEVIFEEAVRFMLDFFFPSDMSLGVKERMEKILGHVKEMPYVVIIFYLEKDADTRIGELIRENEQKVIMRIMEQYSKSKEEALKLYLLELGAVMYKTFTEEDARKLFPEII